MTRLQHSARVIGLMAVAGGLLIGIAGRTEVIFADGLRYIEQAQKISHGAMGEGLLRSTDHPGYPLGIAAMHAVLGGEDPLSWQKAAQAAAVLSGVLLVIPLYLVALEIFGPRIAWLCCLLVYLAPVPDRVMADAMSESTFLHFWTWGFLGALRFLREGRFAWLPLMAGFGVLAYLTRPEGLLLPAAMVATLLLVPLLRQTRLSPPRWAAAVGFLVLAPLAVIGPYAAVKGGLGTKPALARVLGTVPIAASDSVDRARPLDPNQTLAKTYLLALKGAAGAIAEVISIPLLPFVVLGLLTRRGVEGRARHRLFLGIMLSVALLALVRLHATSGYCTSRHAMLLGILLIPMAAAGLDWMLARISLRPSQPIAVESSRFRPAVFACAAMLYAGWTAPALIRPLNDEAIGYRLAGQWLADSAHSPPESKVADGPGWSLFYGRKSGYTFANLGEAAADPLARFVVVRDAHLLGPWGYCQIFRDLVRDRLPVAQFPARPAKMQSHVYVFDRFSPRASAPELAERAPWSAIRR
jgi:4-amino-4-deoxy-L-arabinose transferase-like glycosyltransferase